eukprot:COSAG02_NODE_609_length_19574_cov_18.178537_8_plen_37_part_00
MHFEYTQPHEAGKIAIRIQLYYYSYYLVVLHDSEFS